VVARLRQRRSYRRRGSPRAGAAAVEFALVAPLFLLLLAGIIEFGQAFRIEHALCNAARRGARSAVVDGAMNSQVVQKVKTHCVNTIGLRESDVTVVVAVNGQAGADLDAAATGDEVRVTVSVPFSKAGVGFFANLFSGKVLSSSCALECE
jgi:Flp pilus assembly protein TadG